MNELFDAIAALVSLVSPEKIQAIAALVRQTEVSKAAAELPTLLGTPVASGALKQLAVTWQKHEVGSGELASMLLAASHVYTKTTSEQSTELVWTGPTTPFVSARRTEQALLQVINSAQKSIFITSFVAYDVSSIVNALNSAVDRGVRVLMLLELSNDHGGNVSFDGIGKMRVLVPKAELFAWKEKSQLFIDGSVHAKVAVADGISCFITSANLTGYAMEKNMEAGVLLIGGHVPEVLNMHLFALVETKVIAQI
jgi:cardiolipin synthase